MILTEVEKAYIAGIFDGEGSIGITRLSKPTNLTGIVFQPYATVTNTHEGLIEYLGEKLNASGTYRHESKYQRTRTNFRATKDCQRIRFTYKKAVELCEILLPYLVVKKRQAEACLELASIRDERGKFDEVRTEKEFQLYLKVRRLNGSIISSEQEQELRPVVRDYKKATML